MTGEAYGDWLQRVASLARQLEVLVPGLADLRRYGEQHGLHTSVARLDSLG